MLSTHSSSPAASTQQTATSQLRDVVDDLPWTVGLSKRPEHTEVVVTFASHEVGVLSHAVEVQPLWDARTETHYGYRVSKYHDRQQEPTVVEDRIPSRETALETARNCMKRLTD